MRCEQRDPLTGQWCQQPAVKGSARDAYCANHNRVYVEGEGYGQAIMREKSDG